MKNENKEKTEVKPIKKLQVCSIDFSRTDGDQVLFIKTGKSLEKLFINKETELSDVYKNKKGVGLEYYKLTDKLNEYISRYNRSSSGYQVSLNRFGGELSFDSYVINASILRAVGLSKGIEVVVSNLIVDNEVQKWIEGIAKFIKFLHQNFIEKTSIKAVINLEI